jgi:hypothetical protein
MSVLEPDRRLRGTPLAPYMCHRRDGIAAGDTALGGAA